MLSRLIYVSRVARQVRFDDAEAIAEDAASRNARCELSGLLLYTPSHFIQVLEGPEGSLRDTFARISRDPRHTHVRVISEGVITERAFGAWAMKAAWAPAGRTAQQLEAIGASDALELLRSAAA